MCRCHAVMRFTDHHSRDSDRVPDNSGPCRGAAACSYPRGEEEAARAAGAAGTLYTLSTLSGCKLEDVRKATSGPAWYQVYLCGGRDVATGTIERARQVGYSALVLTMDTPVAGLRERDVRNGVKDCSPARSRDPHVSQFASKPLWLAAFSAMAA